MTQAVRITSQTHAFAFALYGGCALIGFAALTGASSAVKYLAHLGQLGIGMWGVTLIVFGLLGFVACTGIPLRIWRRATHLAVAPDVEYAQSKYVSLVFEGVAAVAVGGCCGLLQASVIMTEGEFQLATPVIVAAGSAARIVQLIVELRRMRPHTHVGR